MAGRGRGRGSAFSYTAEVLGLGRGADAIPASVLQPPPPFPVCSFSYTDSPIYWGSPTLDVKKVERTGADSSLWLIV